MGAARVSSSSAHFLHLSCMPRRLSHPPLHPPVATVLLLTRCALSLARLPTQTLLSPLAPLRSRHSGRRHASAPSPLIYLCTRPNCSLLAPSGSPSPRPFSYISSLLPAPALSRVRGACCFVIAHYIIAPDSYTFRPAICIPSHPIPPRALVAPPERPLDTLPAPVRLCATWTLPI